MKMKIKVKLFLVLIVFISKFMDKDREIAFYKNTSKVLFRLKHIAKKTSENLCVFVTSAQDLAVN